MHKNYISKCKYLIVLERQLIDRWYNKDKLSNREIDYHFGKSPQMISNGSEGQFVLQTLKSLGMRE